MPNPQFRFVPQPDSQVPGVLGFFPRGLHVNNKDPNLLSVLASIHLWEDPLVSAVTEVTSVICTTRVSFTSQQGRWLHTFFSKVVCNAGICLTLCHREPKRTFLVCSHFFQTLSIHISCGKLQTSQSISIDQRSKKETGKGNGVQSRRHCKDG